ncbi:heterokaryon incompatibility protein-domain-containing protein [Bisporella sp. PMI_857]|nr:heterokaryon incompatibility protein-domain-containing protein [Bisporella sp. PMI_857]
MDSNHELCGDEKARKRQRLAKAVKHAGFSNSQNYLKIEDDIRDHQTVAPGRVQYGLADTRLSSVESIEEQRCHSCRLIDLKIFQPTIMKEITASSAEPKKEYVQAPDIVWTHSVGVNADQCPFCRLVIEAIYLNSESKIIPDEVLLIPEVFGKVTYKNALGGKTVQETRRLSIYSSNMRQAVGFFGLTQIAPIGIIQQIAVPAAIGTESLFKGRLVPPSQIDFAQLRAWITTECPSNSSYGPCHNENHQKMNPSYSIKQEPLNLRVIDVVNRMVTNAPQTCNYAALSYVWGDVPQLCLQQPYTLLMQAGSLRDECPGLSQCIKDSLVLCEKLGINFLWVDSLCIKQDDLSDQETYIENMAVIYSMALVTIVAAAGNDHSAGLPGVRPGSRNKKQCIERVEGLCLSPTQCYQLAVQNSVWATRGWTLQEKELSYQLLIFTDYQVYFQSRTKAYREDTVVETSHIQYDPNKTDIQLELVSENDILLKVNFEEGDLKLYCKLLQDYTHRTISHARDSYNAFRGILQAFGKRFTLTDSHLRIKNDLYEYNEFIWGLPSSAMDFALCWHFDSDIDIPPKRISQFPSWSWAGWAGGKLYRSDTARRGELVISGEKLNGGGVSPFYESSLIAFYHDHKLVGNMNDPSNMQHIWKPPGAETTPLSPPPGVPSNHILGFWTSSALLDIGPRVSSASSYYAILSPITPRKKLGRILLDPELLVENTAQQNSLEFVVVGTQYLFSRHLKEKQHQVHVLCIQRKGDVAYRVNKMAQPLAVEDWMAAKPTWKYVALA